MLISLGIALMVALFLLFSSRSLIERSLSMKAVADVLAIFVLGFPTANEHESLRTLALIVIVMGTLFIALILGWSLRLHAKEDALRVDRQ